MGPGKDFWDMIGTVGNGLLVVLAIIMMFWAACSSGSPSYHQITAPVVDAADAA